MELDHRTTFILSIGMFAVVTALDIITTIIALSAGAHELNPMMYDIVTSPGMFLLIKIGAIGLLAYIGWNIEKQMQGAGVVALFLASLVTVLAVGNNFGVIIELMR